MPDSITNTVNVSGTFNALLTGLTDAVVTAMTDELSITKTANKVMWADGQLTYTIVVTNESTTLPYENVTFSDIIDPTIASLVTGSVKLNGADVTHTYDDTTGALTFTIGNIAAASTATITFSIVKK